jgi:hemin uptake protein HemP
MIQECQVGEGRETLSSTNPPPSSGTPSTLRSIRSEDLLQGAREVLIQHGQETYRLRMTKAGKLILNK